MKSLIINGGAPLFGSISAAGSKNAALPILFATVITRGVSRIERLPDIGDVRVALRILEGFGAGIYSEGGATFIDTRVLTYSPPRKEDVCRIRASTYLIGSCLSRFGKCELMGFGGCNFSDRPIDMHISAAETLGAVYTGDRLTARGLFGGEINFKKRSVGATVNAILLAASAVGETVIRGAAREPHIDSLIDFLVSAGAEIERLESEIRIKGRELHGGSISVPGDMIEAGTYLSLGVVSGGEVTVNGCPSEHLSSVIAALSSFGAEVTLSDNAISARPGANMRYADVVASPHPGFPTDLQPIFSVVAACFSGGGIKDTVWQTRFGYLNELSKFGIGSRLSGCRAEIYPSHLRPAKASAKDLRGGMACALAALAAHGESVIDAAEIIERGYESLTEKLESLGARVRIREG